MIINVGGRTDIVNYYDKWLINRIKAGYVYTRNPYNKKQVTRYDLSPKKVDTMIFCSKNYKNILSNMEYILNKYPIFCYYTITAYDKTIEPNVPSIDESIKILKQLSDIINKKRVSWRFDPILFTKKYDIDIILESFEYIASQIHNDISFATFNFVDMYKKVQKNMPEILPLTNELKIETIKKMGKISKKYDMPIQSCASNEDYIKYGINPSGCITTKILEESNNIIFKKIKHKGSRYGCTCMPWRDIGQYDTCLNECKYCYANRVPKVAYKNYNLHDENSPILIDNIHENDIINNANQKSFLKKDSKQKVLF